MKGLKKGEGPHGHIKGQHYQERETHPTFPLVQPKSIFVFEYVDGLTV